MYNFSTLMKYIHGLKRLGLSDEEATVYETLLEKGQANLLNLSHLASIHRPVLYKLLPKMVNKGLIIEVKKGRRTEYIAASPNKLEPLVKSTQNTLETIVDNLNTEYSKKQIVPKIETYYGKDGIGRVFMDVVTSLDKGETYYRYSVRKELYKDFLPKAYRQIRDEKKLERLVITNEEGSQRKKPKLERFVKVLKGDYDVFNVVKIIYKNKIAFIDFENEVAFIVYNERMARLEAEIFLSLYKTLL